ncbi:DUF92 domain-containing protein [Natronosalvus vescus]|uniref:DUF92 domain-containing protein n=1 Tax=Natronosalvus vescus TaxID=2953881 RepID=UPI002090BE69|nr:DUF92 domain-containing protein [Natronosalvus vescus]
MSTPVRRAGAFGALCTLSLAVPILGPELSAPIAVVLALVAVSVTDGPIFDLFAFPDDYSEGRLFGLLTFVLAATTLGLLAVNWSLPMSVFVGVVFLVGYGGFAEAVARSRTDADILQTIAFCTVGALASIAGQAGSRFAEGLPIESAVPVIVFLAVSGTLLAALLRDVLISYDDPIVLLTVGLSLWLLAELEPTIGVTGIAVALAITIAIGYVSHALGAASIAGMLTGILLALLTIVLGGYDWFAVLITFFAVGSVSTKFRYEQKADRGVAEGNDGARGSSNVIGNTAAAMVAVLGFAASEVDLLAVDPLLFLFAFAGAVSTALSDTLSSEIGSVYDNPRLITTLESVEPGTDGAVTWQGELAGIVGAAAVAGVGYAVYPEVGLIGALVIAIAGFAGMTADSVLGATLEGEFLGNQSVNFLATVAGALTGMLVYAAF